MSEKIVKPGIEPVPDDPTGKAMMPVSTKVPYPVYGYMLQQAGNYKFSLAEYIRFRLMQPDGAKFEAENTQLKARINTLETSQSTYKNQVADLNKQINELKSRINSANEYLMKQEKKNHFTWTAADAKKVKQF